MPFCSRKATNPQKCPYPPAFGRRCLDSARFMRTRLTCIAPGINPHNAEYWCRNAVNRKFGLNPPPTLTTEELDQVFGLPLSATTRIHDARVPAYVDSTSVNIMRGFETLQFCSITEHAVTGDPESLAAESVLKEEVIVPESFTGSISDLGGPTANMYHLNYRILKFRQVVGFVLCLSDYLQKSGNGRKQTTELYRKRAPDTRHQKYRLIA